MRRSILRFLTIRVLRVALLVRLSMEVNPLRYFEVGIEAKWPNFLADVHFHLCVFIVGLVIFVHQYNCFVH